MNLAMTTQYLYRHGSLAHTGGSSVANQRHRTGSLIAHSRATTERAFSATVGIVYAMEHP